MRAPAYRPVLWQGRHEQRLSGFVRQNGQLLTPHELRGAVPNPLRAVTEGHHLPDLRSAQSLRNRQGVTPVPEVLRVFQPYREVLLAQGQALEAGVRVRLRLGETIQPLA